MEENWVEGSEQGIKSRSLDIERVIWMTDIIIASNVERTQGKEGRQGRPQEGHQKGCRFATS